MKRFQRVVIILFAFTVTFVIAVNYIYQWATPRTLGPTEFPLEKKWSHCVNGQIRELSTDGNEKLLVRTNKGLEVYELEIGHLIWTSSIKDQVESFPAISATERVFVSDNEYLWAFNLNTGAILWKAPLDLNGVRTWIPDASEKFVLVNSVSDRVIVYNAVSGNELWEIRGGRGYTQAYIDHDKVYIVDRGIKALDASTGDTLWQLNNNRATGLSTFSDGVMYYMEYPGNGTFDLVSYSTKTRSELWRNNFIDNSPNGLYVRNEFLFMADNDFLYQINREDGMINWKVALSDPKDLSSIGKNLYVLEQFHRIIYALDLESGKGLGSLQISFPQVIGAKAQEMVSAGTNLAFFRGCEIFVYGN